MIGDGQCDLVCLTSACGNDGGDCDSTLCSPGCYPYMTKDATCQEACHVEACLFDGSDCDCSPGCISDLLENDDCDPLCAVKACKFDNYACVSPIQGDCAAGCYKDEIGDGVCNPECNNADCKYDELDCGCAPGCDYSDLGNCRAACLVPDCGYDGLPDFPRCPSDLLRESAQYYHMLTRSFNTTFRFSQCAAQMPQCTFDLFNKSESICVPECNAASCVYSFGNCVPRDSNKTCKAPVSQQSSECMDCKNSFNYFLDCVDSCPNGFVRHPLVPDLCYPQQDYTTEKNPALLYVDNVNATTKGQGTLADPFHSLAYALAAVCSSYTTIVVSPGSHDLLALQTSAYLYSVSSGVVVSAGGSETHGSGDTSLVYTPPVIKLVIKGQDSEHRTIFHYINLSPVRFYASVFTLEISNIDFEARSPIYYCSEPRCYYCSYVQMDPRDGIFKTDRGEPIGSELYAPSWIYSFAQYYSFISLSGAEMNLANVSFTGFRQNFTSLLQLNGGNGKFENVTFEDIIVQKAVVVHNEVFYMFPHTSFSYTLGKVTLLNNGFEIRSDLQMYGFFYSTSLGFLLIDRVDFSYNLLAVGSIIPLQPSMYMGSLITLDFCLTLTIQDCVFENNIGAYGTVLKMYSTFFTWSTLITDISFIPVMTHEHIIIKDCVFRNNTGRTGSLLYFYFLQDLQNIEIEDCLFEHELTVGAGLIAVINSKSLDESEMNGQEKTIMDGSGKRVKKFFPPIRLTIENSEFRSCFAASVGLISISLMPNVLLRFLTTSGPTGEATFFTNTLKAYTEREDIYMKLQLELEPYACQSLVLLSKCYALALTNLQFEALKCSAGPIIILQAASGSSNLSSSSFSGLTTGGGILHSEQGVGQLQISAVTVASCTSTEVVYKGLISASGADTQLAVASSTFTSNSAMQQGLIFASNVPVLSLTNSVFRGNKAGTYLGGVVTFDLSTSAGITVTDCQFIENSAGLYGGVMYISGIAASVLKLQISKSVFTANSAASGSAIYITSQGSVDTSTINQCIFTKNQATALYFIFSTGQMKLSDCTFEENTSTSDAILHASYEASSSTYLHLHTVSFTNNTSVSIVYLTSENQALTAIMDYVTFTSNTAVGILLNAVLLTGSNLAFISNRAAASPALEIRSESIITLSNSRFEKNVAETDAGVVIAGSNSIFKCDFCLFANNFAGEKGGVVFLEQDSILNISNSEFTSNSAGLSGSALYFLGCDLSSQVRNSTFRLNSSGRDGVIVLISAALSMHSSVISENTSNKTTAGVVLNLSNFTAEASDFKLQKGVSGVFLYVTTESMANLVRCKFNDGSATSSGGAIVVFGSSLTVEGSWFDALVAPLGGALFVYSNSVLIVTDTSFNNINATSNPAGIIHLYESTNQLQSSHFQSYQGSALSAEKSSLSIRSCTFLKGKGTEGAGLLCTACSEAMIVDSEFKELEAETGGAVSMVGQAGLSSSLVVVRCIFEENHAKDAGALAASSVNAVLDSCAFRNNSAKIEGGKGRGGGVLFTCSIPSVNCQYSLLNSLFEGNSAYVKGGAICWEDVMPKLISISFSNNSATYGNEVSSYAIQLTYGLRTHLDTVVSGQTYTDTLSLALRDHYGTVVATDNESTAELVVTQAGASVSGTWKVMASNGVFTFQNFAITATPGSNTTLNITTNAVDVTKQLRSGDNATYSPSVPFTVSLRNCTLGESEVNSQCLVCGQGTYSLDPALACQDCPTAAICYGNITMVPRAGYWRSSQFTAKFFACPNPSACEGSHLPPRELSYTGDCNEGYEGNLCQSCAENYSRSSKSECAACPEPYINAIRLSGIAFGTLLAVVILVKTSLASARQPKALHSIYLKIFMNYLQLVMLTASFNLSWPAFVLKLFSAQESTGALTEQVFSIDCFINSTSSAEVFMDKLLLMAFVPLILLLAAVIVWVTVSILKRSCRYMKNELTATCIILFFISHPSIVKVAFSIYSCSEVDPGEFWVSTQMNIRCWQGEHMEYALTVALPCILLWGIGVPAVCLIVITAERRKFHEMDTKIKYGFLVNGYKEGEYYWEFVILYRKIIIISISVFLAQISVAIQALAIMGVLVIMIAIQKKHQPYFKRSLNKAEMRSILVAAVTIYCGLYYLTDDLDETSKTLLFVTIVLANAYFLLTWMHKMLGVGMLVLLKWVPCFGRFIQAKTDESISLAKAHDYFAEEVAYNHERNVEPPASMKDLYFAYIRSPIPPTPESEQ